MMTLTLSMICIVLALTQTSYALPPVLIVPGLGNSQLDAVSNRTNGPLCPANTKFQLWLNVQSILFEPDCVFDNLPLKFVGAYTSDRDGVDVTVRHPWDLASIEYLDDNPLFKAATLYFGAFVDYLVVNGGYVRNVNITAAPFDWRHSPDTLDAYFAVFKQKIEGLYNLEQKKVVLVGHSYGNNLIHWFLTTKVSLAWKIRYIEAFIPISPVWIGSIFAPESVISGTSFAGVVTPQAARESQRSFEAVYFFFPYLEGWPTSQVFVQTSTRNYTNTQWLRLLFDLDLANATLIYTRVRLLTVSPSIPPLVKSFVFHGSQIPTPIRLEYATDLNSPHVDINGDGDGTGPIESILYVRNRWPGVVYRDYPGVNHGGILRDPQALNDILTLLRTF